MSLDSFFRLDTEQSHFFDGCIEQEAESFPKTSAARIRPDCLRIETDGKVRVSLAAPVAAWFQMLSELGEVLRLTRNDAAILGQSGMAPDLVDWRNELLPRDEAGLRTPNLAEHASLWALREVSPAGLIHSLEARDASGHAFQKIILTGNSRREVFERFVTNHQRPADEAGGWFSPNHAWNILRWRGIASRIPALRYRHAQGTHDVRRLRSEDLPAILAAAARNDFAVRTTVYTRGMIEGAIWVPRGQEGGGRDGVHFIHGDRAGLHLNFPCVASVWLWAGRCACCDEERWTIEVGNEADEVCLTILAGRVAQDKAWAELLKGCFPIGRWLEVPSTETEARNWDFDRE